MVRFVSRGWLILISLLSGVAAQDHRVLNVPYDDKGNIQEISVYVADFGDPLHSTSSFRLMRPPISSGDTLCTLSNATDFWGAIYDDTIDIGLLLPLDYSKCSAEQQARMAVQLQQTILPTLRFLVFYGIDPKAAVTSVTLTAEEYSDLETMGVVYVPWWDGAVVNALMKERADKTGKSSRLFDLDSTDWEFDVWMEGKVRRSDSSTSRPSLYSDSFYWLRFALFALLILAPLFRGMYLWYAGGGRLHWRRNENGRITGILYIPPVPFWLSAGRFANNQPPVAVKETLSQDEFEKLPEITYVPSQVSEEEAVESDDNEPDYADIDLERAACFDEGSSDEVDRKTTPETLANNTSTATDYTDGESQLTTTCTMCSICIDDFEPGEKLLLLPRCRHAFHRDCVHPWLIERSGACPLCKTNVLMTEAETDDSFLSDENEENSRENGTGNSANEARA